MLNKLKQILATDVLIAVITWLVVAATSLTFMVLNGMAVWQVTLAAVCYLVFIVIWLRITAEKPLANPLLLTFLVTLVALVMAIYWLVPFSYNAILAVLVSAIFPYLMPLARSMVLTAILFVPMYLIYGWHWQQDHMLLTTVLFYTFSLFALIMANTSRRERASREHVEQLNRELIAAQSLLAQASRQHERVRIARDIHDLLGHHLTALILKLQVAEHHANEQNQAIIAECQQLSRLLLSDVREAVSDMREQPALDLAAALAGVIEATPQLSVTLNLQPDVRIDDVQTAHTLVRAVQESLTNTLKHANASKVTIDIAQQQEALTLTIQDNGQGTDELEEGNGLSGLRERVKKLGGTVQFDALSNGFTTIIQLPEAVL